MDKKDNTFNVSSNVIIPQYKTLIGPYSKWEMVRNRELLTANGVEHNKESWRKAIKHESGLIRSTALYFLTRKVVAKDEPIFRKGLKDIDETVQAYSAYGLYHLGDAMVLKQLLSIAHLDVKGHTAAPLAAGLLAQLGHAEAFLTIQKAMECDLEYVQIFGIQNAFHFVSLNGELLPDGKKLDIWDFYPSVLATEHASVKSIAIAQLKEINTPEARELLAKL